MISKFAVTLLAGSALGTLALTTAAPAAAKPAKQSAGRRHAADPRDAEIRELKLQVKALTSRLDADEAAQQAAAQAAQTAQSQAANAQAAAATAQAQATNALTQSQAAQTEVASVSKAVPPLQKAIDTGWFSGTKISGKAYINVSNIHQTSTDLLGNTTDNAQNGTQADLKRFYISVDHNFSSVFSADFTTDVRYNAIATDNGGKELSKDVLVYVKKAYLQAKLNPAFVIRAGASDMPWIPFVEGLYGYRFVENTLIDRTKFGTSTDWGVHVFGTFGNGLVNYQVSAVNGAGYKTLSRSSDTIDLEGRVDVHPIKNITLGVGGYSGKLGKSNDAIPDSATPHSASRFDAVAAYTDKKVRAGIEYFTAKNWNNVTTLANDKSNGWSVFGSYAFTQKFNVFGRYDAVKPSRDIAPDLKDHYFNVGLDYKPIVPIDLAVVYKHERTNNGFISTSNGTIGGADHGNYDEIGLFTQLVF